MLWTEVLWNVDMDMDMEGTVTATQEGTVMTTGGILTACGLMILVGMDVVDMVVTVVMVGTTMDTMVDTTGEDTEDIITTAMTWTVLIVEEAMVPDTETTGTDMVPTTEDTTVMDTTITVTAMDTDMEEDTIMVDMEGTMVMVITGADIIIMDMEAMEDMEGPETTVVDMEDMEGTETTVVDMVDMDPGTITGTTCMPTRHV